MKKFNSILKSYWLPFLILIISACQNEADETREQIHNKFHDPTMVEIYEYQDQRDTDSLLQFLNHEDPVYRATAAEAFGSVQDSLAIPMLAVLLNDENAKVRKSAAYALGQTYDSAAAKPLAMALQAEDSLFVKRELFEALGKVITQPNLEWLNTQPTDDSLEKEGMAWGLYRAGIRNVHDDLSTGVAIVLLAKENNYLTRLGAAHYLYRSQNITLDKYLPQLIEAATTDSSAEVRMAVTGALGKIKSPSAMQVLAEQSLNDVDYRVKINAIRALNAANFEQIDRSIYNALYDENVNVAITAANLIKAKGTDVDSILRHAEKHKTQRVKALLYGAALKTGSDKNDIAAKIKVAYEGTVNAYYKGNLLSALAEHIPNYDFIVTEIFKANEPVIKTSGAMSLVQMQAKPNFPDELRPAFADVFRQLVETGDIGLVAIVSNTINSENYNYLQHYDSIDFLYQAKGKLKLPRDNEALQSLNKAIANYEKTTAEETVNAYNNPINWEMVKTIDKSQKVKIITDKGEVILRLLVEETPGSVANFYKLSQEGYFDGKVFHRVVPNFVAQGGGNRGDGYGSEDYSIRSEFANLRYKTGTLGMASAGKDTEGTQWFITHSPTPHLDGRYTIFAQVEKGMEVVHQIEEGDRIKSVELMKD